MRQGILNALQGIGIGLLNASGPSATPNAWGPAIGAGLQYANALNQQQQKERVNEALLNLKKRQLISPSGVAGQLRAADALEMNGNHEEANIIRQAVSSGIGLQKARSNFYTNPLRYIPTTERAAALGAGLNPDQMGGTNNVLGSSLTSNAASSLSSPLIQNAIKKTAALDVLKKTVPQSLLNRNVFATNIEKTLDSIDFPTIANFSSPEKQLYYKSELAKSIANPNYDAPADVKKYNAFINQQVPLLTSQINQFYKGSVQPQEIQRLQSLIQPAAWANNPNLAINSFNTLRNILTNEIKTVRGTVESPDVYRGIGTASQYSPTFPVNTQNLLSSPSIANTNSVNEDNIKDIMKRYNLTRSQVINRLKEVGVIK